MYDEAYPATDQAAGIGTLKAAQMESYSQRIKRQVAQAERQLADLKRMQEIFTAHPEFEELLTLVQRNGRL